MYVELRSAQAVHSNLKMSCGLTEQSVYVVPSVLTSTVVLLLIFTKELSAEDAVYDLPNFAKTEHKYGRYG